MRLWNLLVGAPGQPQTLQGSRTREEYAGTQEGDADDMDQDVYWHGSRRGATLELDYSKRWGPDIWRLVEEQFMKGDDLPEYLITQERAKNRIDWPRGFER